MNSSQNDLKNVRDIRIVLDALVKSPNDEEQLNKFVQTIIEFDISVEDVPSLIVQMIDSPSLDTVLNNAGVAFWGANHIIEPDF